MNVWIPFEIPAKSMKNHDIARSEISGFIHFKEHMGKAVSKWENESAKPKILTIRKMATLWGISVEYILEQERILRL